MTAIVTNRFRVVNAENFKRDITDTDNSVYVFIGKSDPWSDAVTDLTDAEAPTPVDTQKEIAEAYTNMMAAKKTVASGISHVVPRYNWTSGNAYVAWNDRDDDMYTKQFYVITDENQIYKCLKAGPGASLVKPTGQDFNPISLGDGYIWKFMHVPTINEGVSFLTNFYMPIKTVVLPAGGYGDLSATDKTAYDNQTDSAANLNGKIYNAIITSGGSGYTSAPSVQIVGDGTGATATATVIAGVVTAINITNAGSGYTLGELTITGGGGAGAAGYPIMSPGVAHGVDPVTELGAFYVAVTTRFEYDDGDSDFIVGNNFRQVGLIKNPLDANGTAINTATTFSALKTMQLQSAVDLVVGDYITGSTSGAVAYIDDIDLDTLIVKFHQNKKTGYKSFVDGEAIAGSVGVGGSGTLAGSNAIGDSEYTPNSGQIIFVESRDPINRSISQIEDVKIIIEF
jgi:hypothetical protein